MKALILQHEKSTPAGSTTEWLSSRQIPFQILEPPSMSSLPPSSDFDILFICGGSMNVDEEDKHPWLQTEKNLIRRSIEERKLMVGLCLGGQLIAEALGGAVVKQPQWEVGWHSVELSDGASLKVFQWHGYGFSIPPGARLTATNPNHANQAFIYGNFALGFQFHPETTEEWALQCAASPRLPKQGFVQNAEEIKRDIRFQPDLQKWYFSQLDALKETKTKS